MTMKLYSNATSPFGRKVKIAARVKGVWPGIDMVMTDPNVPLDPVLAAANPLHKIPALILEDGTSLYDSSVICEYLDTLAATPRLIPASGPARFEVLKRAALVDGLLEAAVAIIYESRRDEALRSQAWIDRQQRKVDAAVRELDASLPAWSGAPDLGSISAAVALGYLDLRQGGRWRARHPRLVAWLDQFAAAVPAFEQTAPPAA